MHVLRARYVVPVTEPPIEDGVVAYDDDGTIRYVGPRRGAPAGGVRDLGDSLLMPGLVNAHTHLELTAMRGFLEDLEFRRWILRLTSAKRSVLTQEMLLDSARLGVMEGLMAGVTTFADTCDSGLALDALVELGARGIVYREVFGPDPVVCDAAIEDLREQLESMRHRETRLVRVGISPHAPYTVSDDLFRASARLAAEARVPMAVHIAESEAESSLIVSADGPFAEGLRARGIGVAPRALTPIQLLAQLGVLSVRPLLIHCVRVDANDIATIARSGCPVAHCPISNAKLGHGVAPLVELLSAGIRVALGTDSVAANNRMDILEEARMAVLAQRARLLSHQTLTAHDVLEIATMGGAAALGLDSQIGSLEAGKAADLAAFPVGLAVPTHDPETAAVFALGGTRASFVAVAGRPLVVDGAPIGFDPGVPARVERAAAGLRSWLDGGGELVPPPPVGTR